MLFAGGKERAGKDPVPPPGSIAIAVFLWTWCRAGLIQGESRSLWSMLTFYPMVTPRGGACGPCATSLHACGGTKPPSLATPMMALWHLLCISLRCRCAFCRKSSNKKINLHEVMRLRSCARRNLHFSYIFPMFQSHPQLHRSLGSTTAALRNKQFLLEVIESLPLNSFLSVNTHLINLKCSTGG